LGVNLTPIIVKEVVDLDAFRGHTIAIDAFNVLYQFLALIRTREGRPLSDSEGRVTSHLVGLAFRTTRLIADHGVKLVFVFDGSPPRLKRREVEKRRAVKRKAEEEYREAVDAGDYAKAFSKAVQTSRLTGDMIWDTKRLLDLLGVPWVQAPGEGEAQAAHMARKGDVWGSSSRDYDSLLFGTPRLVRYLTIQGQEWLPSKGRARLEEMPPEAYSKLDADVDGIREIFLKPDVTDDYKIIHGALQEDELYDFLCGERAFSRDRVEVVVKRMKAAQMQRSLSDWIGGAP